MIGVGVEQRVDELVWRVIRSRDDDTAVMVSGNVREVARAVVKELCDLGVGSVNVMIDEEWHESIDDVTAWPNAANAYTMRDYGDVPTITLIPTRAINQESLVGVAAEMGSASRELGHTYPTPRTDDPGHGAPVI